MSNQAPGSSQRQSTNTSGSKRKQRYPPRAVAATAPLSREDANSISDEEALNVDLPLIDEKYLSNTRFDSFNISNNSKRALAEVLQYQFCTHVQSASISACLGKQDVIAKARTGSGKTLAFVIPLIEKVLANRAPRGKVSALVLSPTRELARQIAVETQKLLTFHPDIKSQVVYGGVKVERNIAAITRAMPDILIATPGRCYDLMTQRTAPGLNALLSDVRVLVFDEADNLLDMGFRPQISKILACLPPPSRRQTYLFSATFPEDVKQLTNVALSKDHVYIDAVGEEVDTHVHVEHTALVVPQPQLMEQAYMLLAQHMAAEPEFKVVVFLPTAAQTSVWAEAFSKLKLPVLEIHSRLTQSRRDKVADEFRSGSRVIMFSSDVSARGVDYPNVTYVLQVGSPTSRDQYVHRSGRTGRAGKAGSCALLLADWETAFLSQLKDIPLQRMQPLEAPAQVCSAVFMATKRVAEGVRTKAYRAFLGYYASHRLIKMPKEEVVRHANVFAEELLGCDSPPALSAELIGKMGLKGVVGLKKLDKASSGNGGRGGGGGGGQRGGNGGGGPQQQQQQGQGQQQQGQQQQGHVRDHVRGAAGGSEGAGGGGGGRRRYSANASRPPAQRGGGSGQGAHVPPRGPRPASAM